MVWLVLGLLSRVCPEQQLEHKVAVRVLLVVFPGQVWGHCSKAGKKLEVIRHSRRGC